MTFSEIVNDLAERLSLKSDDARERIGREVNKAHRRITAKLGIDTHSRVIDATVSAGIGNRDVTVPGVEKVLSVKVAGGDFLGELSHAQMEQRSVSETPRAWTPWRVQTGSIIIRLDAIPQEETEFVIRGYERAPDLSGSQEPWFEESWHYLIAEAVAEQELRRQEKLALAMAAKTAYDDGLSDLQLHRAKSTYLSRRQGGSPRASMASGGGGGGGVPTGEASYIQTGQILFDRDPSAPFAVSEDSACVPNLCADLLDGEHGAFYRSASNLNAGTLPDARFPSTLPAVSGANLTNLDASDLATGTIPDARFPSTLPAVSGANLTNLDASDLASGTIPDARFPAVLPAISGENLTNLPTPPAAIPVGGMMMWGTASAPTNWLLCNGAAVSRTTYAALFAVYGETFGVGDTTTTFNLPDFRQRFPLGVAASGTGSTLAGTGGSIDHVHAGPSHSHTISEQSGHTHTGPEHSHTISGSGTHTHSFSGTTDAASGASLGAPGSDVTPAHDHTFSGTTGADGDHSHGGSTGNAGTGNTGSAGTHDHGGSTGSAGTGNTGSANPPFLAIHFIIYAGV